MAAAGMAAPPSAQFTKAICTTIFPNGMPFADQCRRSKEAGFEGVELALGRDIMLTTPVDEVKRMGEEAHKAGLAVVSLWCSEPFSNYPLNSPDPEKRARGVENLRKGIDLATYLNCGAMLLVPGRLGNGAKFLVGYQDTWDRFTAELKKAIPDALRAKVCLTPENVWNKFLVSPTDMRDFVDQFRSPWLQTHFDIGNVMQFGYPQDWILTLGPRLKRIHLKDYKLSARAEQGRFVDLLEGDVDWKEVMAALVKVGYRGYLSPEIGYDRNNPDKLMQVSRAVDKILAMA